MPILLFLTLIIGVPLTELYLLIEVGSEIGALPTIALTLLTAALGIWLVRMQGLGVLARVGRSMAADELPALELMDGALLLVAGLLLLLPGFLTDALGFVLLVPPVRQWLIRRYVRLVPASPSRGDPRDPGPRVIEGRFRRED
ncbi:MAG: FxsA family protein [Bdellovibrio bacteriovorus]